MIMSVLSMEDMKCNNNICFESVLTLRAFFWLLRFERSFSEPLALSQWLEPELWIRRC